eukprot:TRINITY_DN20168_c0_g1_i1.p1 TRINITY_DN20168_c0_g1~~TRINITY_DN20168_c0_g1_i1.p1  ORF type:complete len:257 (-),score=25.76 TRINITY_DN20168_c0_g1_i1:87-746(-)
MTTPRNTWPAGAAIIAIDLATQTCERVATYISSDDPCASGGKVSLLPTGKGQGVLLIQDGTPQETVSVVDLDSNTTLWRAEWLKYPTVDMWFYPQPIIGDCFSQPNSDPPQFCCHVWNSFPEQWPTRGELEVWQPKKSNEQPALVWAIEPNHKNFVGPFAQPQPQPHHTHQLWSSISFNFCPFWGVTAVCGIPTPTRMTALLVKVKNTHGLAAFSQVWV